MNLLRKRNTNVFLVSSIDNQTTGEYKHLRQRTIFELTKQIDIMQTQSFHLL